MNELIGAAKAVIDLYDYTGPLDECEAINRLIAAVDRAEKQKYTGFEEWWDKNADLKYKFVPIGQAKQLWNAASTAAQQAERERIKNIVDTIGVQGEHDAWFDACVKIMEAIDDL